MKKSYEHDVLDNIGGGEASLEFGKSLQLGVFRFFPAIAFNWTSSEISNYDFGVSDSQATADRDVLTSVEFEKVDPFKQRASFRNLFHMPHELNRWVDFQLVAFDTCDAEFEQAVPRSIRGIQLIPPIQVKCLRVLNPDGGLTFLEVSQISQFARLAG